MRAVIVYESMFGNTRRIAESIAEGLGGGGDVQLVRAAEGGTHVLDGADLVVVGGPTHAWGMSRPSTRRGAPGYVDKSHGGLALEPGADAEGGVREWLGSLGALPVPAAAFDTRIKAPSFFTGRASKAIARALADHGAPLVAPPESFFVDRKSHLVPGQIDRARSWGSRLARTRSEQVGRRT